MDTITAHEIARGRLQRPHRLADEPRTVPHRAANKSRGLPFARLADDEIRSLARAGFRVRSRTFHILPN